MLFISIKVTFINSTIYNKTFVEKIELFSFVLKIANATTVNRFKCLGTVV